MTKIIHYHSEITSRDAIGTSINLLHSSLQAKSYDSYICCADEFIARAAPGVVPVSGIINARMGISLDESDVVIFHFSFLDKVIDRLAGLPLRRVLVYHNVTPGHFFREAGMDWLGAACDQSRQQLAGLASRVDVSVGDSDYNVKELKQLGFDKTSTIPVMIDSAAIRSNDIDAELLAEVRSEAEVNILFVGRFVPNKRIERVISTLAHFRRSFPMSINLHLVGKVWDERYFASLIGHAGELGVASLLRLHIHAEPRRLRTLYAAADAFICMSDHEGFMVPILEAFWAGCPVIAANEAAVGETMGGAGLLMSSPDPAFAASLIYLLKTDLDLRRRVVVSQGRRAAAFHAPRVAERWHELIETLSPRN